MQFVISGLTAAGKTTLARKMVDQFDFGYVSASTILRRALGDTSDRWTPELDRRRTELSVERGVDRLVLEAFESSAHAVFDCWGLPWLIKESSKAAVLIWIESDLESRFRKCFVSYLQRGEPKSYNECRDIVLAKDAKSRDIFMSNWGFDIYADRSPFDLVLDASSLMPDADPALAVEGAGVLYQACLGCVRGCGGEVLLVGVAS